MGVKRVVWRTTGHFNHLHLDCDTSAECIPLGKELQRRGCRVAEHEAFGGVAPYPVHMRTSHHYDNPSTSLDVNKAGTWGTSDVEQRFLDGIAAWLRTNPTISDEEADLTVAEHNLLQSAQEQAVRARDLAEELATRTAAMEATLARLDMLVTGLFDDLVSEGRDTHAAKYGVGRDTSARRLLERISAQVHKP